MSVYICAWCGKALRQSSTPEDSHGVCRPCFTRQIKEIPFFLRIKAQAKVDGWSAVAAYGLVYVALGLWALEVLWLGVM
jgi:DNA-directed RNA polymerase subunit RPC12/RpoP